jgi:hypothetical protein
MHDSNLDNLLLSPTRLKMLARIVADGGTAHIRDVRRHSIQNDCAAVLDHHTELLETAGIIVKRKLIDERGKVLTLLTVTMDGKRRFLAHCAALKALTAPVVDVSAA